MQESIPDLIVVQVISDTNKQDCIRNERVPQCTKNESLLSSSITLLKSKNRQLALVIVKADSKNPQHMKILIHVGCISTNAIFMQFHVILPDISSFVYKPTLRYFW